MLGGFQLIISLSARARAPFDCVRVRGIRVCANYCSYVSSKLFVYRIYIYPKMLTVVIFARLAFACIALKLALDVRGQSATGQLCPECDVDTCENETLVQESCPDSTLVADPCACCKVCGRTFGETCGGAYEYLGKCEYSLVCTANSAEYFNGVNISGICTSKYCI